MRKKLTKVKASWRYYLRHHSAQLVVVSLVIVLGALLLVASHAATPVTSLEAESGALTSPAATISDTTASGGHAIQFGSSAGGSSSNCQAGWTGSPPYCVNLAPKNCEPTPSSCGYPDASTTGPLPGATLTQVPSQATSGSGWTYANGTVTITGNVGSATTGLQLAPGDTILIPDGTSNITIENIKLTGLEGENTDGINVGGNSGCRTAGCGANNITIKNCFIDGGNDTTESYYESIHQSGFGSSLQVYNCDLSQAGGEIALDREQGNDVAEGNYIHDPGEIPNTNNHDNGIATGNGPGNTTSSFLIQANTLIMTGTNSTWMTAPISLFPDGGPQLNDNATISDNLLDTGNYYLIDNGYGDAYGSSGQSYISIINNRLGDSGQNAGIFYYTWYIKPNVPGCSTGNGGVACTGDVDSGNFWDATLAAAP